MKYIFNIAVQCLPFNTATSLSSRGTNCFFDLRLRKLRPPPKQENSDPPAKLFLRGLSFPDLGGLSFPDLVGYGFSKSHVKEAICTAGDGYYLEIIKSRHCTNKGYNISLQDKTVFRDLLSVCVLKKRGSEFSRFGGGGGI